MTITSAPLVVVVGSAGAQGYRVIKALTKPYHLRGLTLDTSQPVTKEVVSRRVDMVVIDPRPENKGQVVKVFESADIVVVAFTIPDIGPEGKGKVGLLLYDTW
ncbi:hypothetical protein FRB94_000628 [Tulasnella sp. JGI-2019a]|nr:hypothetical protein FRB94_000628 [Tulasnella sp. JGI-2019a]